MVKVHATDYPVGSAVLDGGNHVALGTPQHPSPSTRSQLAHSPDLDRSVRVLHAAVLAKRQALAILLQFLGALVGFLAGLQALGCGLVGLGHGPVPGNVLLNVFVAVLGQGSPRQAHGGKKKGDFVHGFIWAAG
jgi:hypothetical protein